MKFWRWPFHKWEPIEPVEPSPYPRYYSGPLKVGKAQRVRR